MPTGRVYDEGRNIYVRLLKEVWCERKARLGMELSNWKGDMLLSVSSKLDRNPVEFAVLPAKAKENLKRNPEVIKLYG